MKKSSELPVYLFHQGTNYRSYEFLGAHAVRSRGEKKVVFRVWAPHADSVSVVGDFNGWNAAANPMMRISSGIWETTISGVEIYDAYKYAVTHFGKTVLKADPFAVHSETTPKTASKYYELPKYRWRSKGYEEKRKNYDHATSPMNIFEVNALSWRKNSDGSYYSYRRLADELVPYVKEMGYTHVEFMPLTEYPFDGSWGYQVTGYFSVTSRLGTPEDFMYLVDSFHLAGIGVILDWVPAHFPKDEHGLFEFDGTYLYEDFRETRREHKSWGTRIFDYGKTEIQSFLISSASFFFDVYRIDGLRVDAVASMLYLDYDRKDGEWQPNSYGTNINLEAVAFLRKFNTVIHELYPHALTIAEESTAFPNVTSRASEGGLGFDYKWNMGWMNDSLSYIKEDPMYRVYHHNKLTFTMTYAFSENFVLPISHDEVVYGKGSLIGKMPGDYDMKFAGVRTFIGYMLSHPGKKLMFMGQEIGQFREWAYAEGLEYFLLGYEKHAALQKFFRDANAFYKDNDAFYSFERSWEGFEWLVVDDGDNNVFAYERRGASGERIVAIMNFSGRAINGYRLGVNGKRYSTAFDSEERQYGGAERFTHGVYKAEKIAARGKELSLSVDLDRLSFVYLKEE